MTVRLVLALVPLFAWGDLVLVVLAPRSRSRLFRVAAAWLLGSGVASVLTFLALAAGAPLRASVIAVGALGILLRLVAFRRRSMPGIVAWGQLSPAALVVALEAGQTALAAAVTPLAAWDAWVNWASKARVLLLDQHLTRAVFGDPTRLATNPSYPLFLPLVESALATALGGWDDAAAAVVAVLFHLSLLALSFVAARRLLAAGPALVATALVATTPWISRGAHGALADVPLAALVLLAFLLVADDDAATPRGAALAGLAAGLLPWMKTEGAIWLALALVAFVARLARSGARRGIALVFASAGALVALPHPLFLAAKGTVAYVYLPLGAATLLENAERIPRIGWELAKRFVDRHANGVFLLAAAALLARGRRALEARDGWTIAPALLFPAVASASYVLSRFDPWIAHLTNSIDRLVLQAVPLAVWFLAAQAADSGLLEREPGLEAGGLGRT